jgi:hypothetical protein
MLRIPPIKTPRQYRFLSLLLQYGELSTKQMRDLVGALNLPEVKRSLKVLGWVIHCHRESFIDRDGKHCRPGYYWLDDEEKKRAHIALGVCKEEWEAATSHSNKPDSSQSQQDDL